MWIWECWQVKSFRKKNIVDKLSFVFVNRLEIYWWTKDLWHLEISNLPLSFVQVKQLNCCWYENNRHRFFNKTSTSNNFFHDSDVFLNNKCEWYKNHSNQYFYIFQNIIFRFILIVNESDSKITLYLQHGYCCW